MQQFIQLFSPDAIPSCGLVNICNIEEIWLNEWTNSVSIRYRSPNGRLVEHDECFDNLRVAKLRYSTIKDDVLDNPHHRFSLEFIKSLKAKKEEMEAKRDEQI